jgi:hypothetical protein
MIPQTSITMKIPPSAGRPVMFARSETFGRTVLRVAKQYGNSMRGCFPMTD